MTTELVKLCAYVERIGTARFANMDQDVISVLLSHQRLVVHNGIGTALVATMNQGSVSLRMYHTAWAMQKKPELHD